MLLKKLVCSNKAYLVRHKNALKWMSILKVVKWGEGGVFLAPYVDNFNYVYIFEKLLILKIITSTEFW